MIELTGFTKANGPLTKRISLAADGSVASDGSSCLMARGSARRVRVGDVDELAYLIERVQSDQAIALGALRPGLPEQVTVVTKQKLTGAPDVIARTGTDIVYRKLQPAFALVDFDQKGLQASTATVIRERGGLWPTLISVLPVLGTVAHVVRRSTSAGLYRSDTGQRLAGSGGQHIFVPVVDGTDIERFLQTLHERCWLAGLGWFIVGAGGQLLERSIVDRMVGAPERLVFEGAPILEPPLQQDRDSRRAVPVAGDTLDTLAACPSLDVAERSKLRELKLKVIGLFGNEIAKARRTFISTRAQDLAARTGLTLAAAEHEIERQCEGVLRPDLVLPFDDEDLEGCTVADVLADPPRFEGATLADPLEGVDYGRCVARIMRREDGTPWIHSFAHGRTVYELEHNAASVRAAVAKADDSETANVFLKLALGADLDAAELAQIRNEVAKRSGLGKREMATMLKAAQQEHAAKRRQQERARRAKERTDPRPQIARPDDDADWLPMMDVLNGVISKSNASHPPARDIDDAAAKTRKLVVPKMHAFSSAEELADGLPAPEQWLIKRLDEPQTAEMIERHIDFIGFRGNSVHLQTKFVRHYMIREDNALPILVAVATLPLVLADGTVSGRADGFDRKRGIDFRIQPEVAALVPQPGSVSDDEVERAMRFLADEWLVDVATDYAGKCTIIAAGLTIIERSLLDQRPAFFVTAGRRGGGKTTTLTMLIKAVTGIWPAAAAWSTNEDERRKALLSYFMSGVPYILWDNINRGTQVGCPHIEKSCTAAFYADRKLGVSEMVATAASTIHFFTGNNIGPKGDLASRSLVIRIELDRHDPENREFTHPDPIGWTDSKRADILRALYTILIGNPNLKQTDAPLKTRFKLWWRLVGSAVEHAANLVADRTEPGAYEPGEPLRPCAIDFRELFLAREDEDEDSVSLAEALAVMERRWPAMTLTGAGTFTASDVANLINTPRIPVTDAQGNHVFDEYGNAIFADNADGVALRDFLYPDVPSGFRASPKSVGRMLRNHIDEPVKHGGRTLILRKQEDLHTKQWVYAVKVKLE